MATPTLTPKNHRRRRKRKKKHQRSYSQALGVKKHKEYKVPRKLGPVDIGRNNYKGTKYEDTNYVHFLQEKIHPHARSSSFDLRKKRNPLQKNPTISEIGTPNSWKKPTFYDVESERMKRDVSRLDFLLDTKPIHTRDKSLDLLKDSHLPKGQFARDTVAPFAWQPIDYELQVNKNNFLTEKCWFDSSKIHIDIDDRLSHLLQTLPPEKLLLIQDIPPPTGYESKLNYINKLKQFVIESARNNHNMYALNLLNVGLDALNDGNEGNDKVNNNHNIFNITLDALSDEPESDNGNENEKKSDDEIIRISQLVNASDDEHENENQTEEKNGFDIDMMMDDMDDFDSQMNDVLEEVLAPSPSPQSPQNNLDHDQYQIDYNDRQLEDALIEILAPSPSPQPQPISNKAKQVNRRELLRTVQMNLDDIQNKSKTHLRDLDDNKCETKELELAQTVQLLPAPDPILNIDDAITIQAQIQELEHVQSVQCDEKEAVPIGNNSKYEEAIPSDFICPISHMIMNEAVMAADGRIYDRLHMEKWLKTHDVSPISGKKLRHNNLMVFNELTNKIKCWKKKNMVKKKRKKRKRRSGSFKRKKSKHKDIVIALSPLVSSPLSPLSPLSQSTSNETVALNNFNLNIAENKNVLEIGIDSSDTS